MDTPISFSPFDERIPLEELHTRHARIRRTLADSLPQAGGLLLLGDTNIYYASGTISAGVVWLPADGDPVVFVRKGLQRVVKESPLTHIMGYRSFGDLIALSCDAGSPIPQEGVIAVDMGAVTWSTANMLQKKFSSVQFISGDMVMKRCRSVKSSWEITKIRRAGSIQTRCLYQELPPLIHPGMTEWEIAGIVRDLYRRHGDCGLVRVTPPGRISTGGVSVGDSGLYPMAFDGPLGVRGLHPAVPYIGSKDIKWQKNQLVTIDMPCCFEGYVSDKTVTYFSGDRLPDDILAAADCCAEVYEQARIGLRAGALPSEVWTNAQKTAARHGLTEMFMGTGPDQVRFLGHGLGLEMDEYPAIANRFDDPLEAGTVIALEPKIAVPAQGVVGMEDTFLVGDSAAESLSGQAQPIVMIGD